MNTLIAMGDDRVDFQNLNLGIFILLKVFFFFLKWVFFFEIGIENWKVEHETSHIYLDALTTRLCL